MNHWLSERRRSAFSGLTAACAAVVLLLLTLSGAVLRLSPSDCGVVVLFAYLCPYLCVTLIAFSNASPARIRSWARRETRGTITQRWLLGTAPGPGASIFIAAAALLVAMVWLPGYIGSVLSVVPRALVALSLVVIAWICVVVAFAVAFQADNLVEDEQGLEFPGTTSVAWADYVYFALSVMTTFGTTDVNVTSREMRRTVSANAVIAFVFNTVTVASLVSALSSG
ncbi:DUF1345 domain-containing protein [Streptomyces sp. x-19]|uniref:DUF1345 domain-containing protein n=1 Tax=Streptomyces sp. x-19 TaxID=2789280 RepID=UPI003980524E